MILFDIVGFFLAISIGVLFWIADAAITVALCVVAIIFGLMVDIFEAIVAFFRCNMSRK